MTPLAQRPYLRMNGIGNRIVVLDLLDLAHTVTPAEARAVAAREPYDQMMVLERPRRAGTDAFMRIYNGDGSEAGACGNGTRCVAWHLMPKLGRDRLTLETATSLVRTARQGSLFTVDMGPPRLAWDEIPLAEPFADTRAIELQIGPIDAPVLHTPSAVSMGNPHAVFWVDRDPQGYDLARFGPMLEHHPVFPERANISLAQVVGRDRIRLNTWERGAGLTLACGSAACAVVVAGVRLGLVDRTVTVGQRGGELLVEWREADGHVLMTGPAVLEHEGRLDPAWFADAA